MNSSRLARADDVLHVLVAQFLLQHEQQQVLSKRQADPWFLCNLALADGVEGERRVFNPLAGKLTSVKL